MDSPRRGAGVDNAPGLHVRQPARGHRLAAGSKRGTPPPRPLLPGGVRRLSRSSPRGDRLRTQPAEGANPVDARPARVRDERRAAPGGHPAARLLLQRSGPLGDRRRPEERGQDVAADVRRHVRQGAHPRQRPGAGVPEGAAFTLRGIPSIVSIRAGGLAMFPRLAERLLATRDSFRMRQTERDTGAPGAPVRAVERHLITPKQLANLLRTRQVGRGEHPIVVMPRITGRPGTFTLRRIRAPQAGRALQDSLFGSRHWAETTQVFNAHEEAPADTRAVAENRRLFVERTPFFVCEMGTDLYRSEANYTELVRTLISLADEKGAPDRTCCRGTALRAAPPREEVIRPVLQPGDGGRRPTRPRTSAAGRGRRP